MEIRHTMIEEFGFVFCQRCEESGKPWYEMHHIIYRSEKPGHDHLHDKENLINLCPDCHEYYHENKSRRQHLVEERNLVELFGNEILKT